LDIFLFSITKFSCQYFSLKFGGMLQNTQMHLFVVLVVAGWLEEKLFELQNTPKFVFFAFLDPHHKKIQLL